jgi:rubredoxin
MGNTDIETTWVQGGENMNCPKCEVGSCVSESASFDNPETMLIHPFLVYTCIDCGYIFEGKINNRYQP